MGRLTQEYQDYLADMRNRIIEALTTGPLRTEEIRMLIIEDRNTVYGQLKRLEEMGLVEGNHPRQAHNKKWRIKQNAKA